MIDRIDDPILTAFAPLVGLPAWGVDRVHGSILSLEFGSPRLNTREPYVSTSPSAKVRQRAAMRVVKPVGEWNLVIFCCHWRFNASGETVADDDSTHEQIDAAARALDGQKLVGFALDAATRATTFAFDLGSTLATWPYEADEDEQWSLYLPGRCVLTYRADGRYSLGPSDGKPGTEVWHPVTRSMRVP